MSSRVRATFRTRSPHTPRRRLAVRTGHMTSETGSTTSSKVHLASGGGRHRREARHLPGDQSRSRELLGRHGSAVRDQSRPRPRPPARARAPIRPRPRARTLTMRAVRATPAVARDVDDSGRQICAAPTPAPALSAIPMGPPHMPVGSTRSSTSIYGLSRRPRRIFFMATCSAGKQRCTTPLRRGEARPKLPRLDRLAVQAATAVTPSAHHDLTISAIEHARFAMRF